MTRMPITVQFYEKILKFRDENKKYPLYFSMDEDDLKRLKIEAMEELKRDVEDSEMKILEGIFVEKYFNGIADDFYLFLIKIVTMIRPIFKKDILEW